MRDLLSDKVDEITSLKEASEYLQELSEAIPSLSIEHHNIAAHISAISGFLEDFNESADMKPKDFKRLCTIVFESLFYE